MLLAEFDTVSDFVGYLYRRETAIKESINLTFRELDLMMLFLIERSAGQWGLILLPESTGGGGTVVPAELWSDPYAIVSLSG